MPTAPDTGNALRRSEERLRLIAENARDTIWTMAPDGTITYVSPAVQAVRGITPEEAMRQRPEEIHPPESLARSGAYFVAMLEDIAAGRTPKPFRGDLEYYRHDGSTFWTEVLAFPILDERGQLIELLGVSRDLSDRRTREAELRTAQRLDAMARIAGGVSHEVNNALTIIQTASERLASIGGDGPEARECTEVMASAVHRIAMLTSRLLAFARRRPTSMVAMPAGDLLRRLAPELESMAAPSPVRFVLDDEVAACRLRVDVALLAETLDVLVRNAAQASGNGGEIEIAFGVCHVEAPLRTRTRDLNPGRHVTIRVTDTGPGMTAETIEHAFEPFFADDGDHRSDALGLATVFGLTKHQDGGLTVESHPGRGTSFTLWWPETSVPADLPAAEASAAATRDAASSPIGPAHGDVGGRRRTILLVDDDLLVLRGTARLIESGGYRVVQASSATEALAHAAREPFDLVVTDVRMPGMTGFDLVDALIERGVTLPVLFVSGDVGAGMPASLSERISSSFLAKPFTGEELRQQLHRMLRDVPERR